mmetsp:Transcript_64492/g.139514  ORF Transcript_64492/g.139514 Transcript_64492/m.139514 type:complete len:326 (+) Transcript_64492:338-1315(+)
MLGRRERPVRLGRILDHDQPARLGRILDHRSEPHEPQERPFLVFGLPFLRGESPGLVEHAVLRRGLGRGLPGRQRGGSSWPRPRRRSRGGGAGRRRGGQPRQAGDGHGVGQGEVLESADRLGRRQPLPPAQRAAETGPGRPAHVSGNPQRAHELHAGDGGEEARHRGLRRSLQLPLRTGSLQEREAVRLRLRQPRKPEARARSLAEVRRLRQVGREPRGGSPGPRGGVHRRLDHLLPGAAGPRAALQEQQRDARGRAGRAPPDPLLQGHARHLPAPDGSDTGTLAPSTRQDAEGGRRRTGTRRPEEAPAAGETPEDVGITNNDNN